MSLRLPLPHFISSLLLKLFFLSFLPHLFCLPPSFLLSLFLLSPCLFYPFWPLNLFHNKTKNFRIHTSSSWENSKHVLQCTIWERQGFLSERNQKRRIRERGIPAVWLVTSSTVTSDTPSSVVRCGSAVTGDTGYDQNAEDSKTAFTHAISTAQLQKLILSQIVKKFRNLTKTECSLLCTGPNELGPQSRTSFSKNNFTVTFLRMDGMWEPNKDKRSDSQVPSRSSMAAVGMIRQTWPLQRRGGR